MRGVKGDGERLAIALLVHHISFEELREAGSPTFLKSRGSGQTIKINMVNY